MLRCARRLRYDAHMSDYPASPSFRHRPVSDVIRALFCMQVAWSLAFLDASFAMRVLDASGRLPFQLIFMAFLVLAILLSLILFGLELFDDPLMPIFVGAVSVLVVGGLLWATASKFNPHNGWSHLWNMGEVRNAASAIQEQGGSLHHPANRVLPVALDNPTPSATLAAAQWIEKQELLDRSETHRVRMVLSILGHTELANEIAARGWAGKEDLLNMRQWALEHPLDEKASLLQADAWLHAAGETPWSEELKAENTDTQNNEAKETP